MKKVLVIGASTGIGQAIVKHEKQQNHIISFSRSGAAGHDDYQLDVLTDDLPDLTALDALVYCPGSINLKSFKQLKREDFLADFEVNVLGAIRSIQKYLLPLKKSGDASITLFSTVAVGTGMPFHTSISASKGAIEGVMRSLAAELAPNIKVNAIAPTIVDTPLAQGILRNEKVIESTVNRHPLKRILAADEVADLVSYLINGNKSMSGQVLTVDAGISRIKN